MSNWLSRPGVRLGLLVNGLYLLSLAMPLSPPHARTLSAPPLPPPPARLRASANAPDYPSLHLQTGPLKAETHYWRDSDQLDFYLSREMTLIRRPGHTLLLSPT